MPLSLRIPPEKEKMLIDAAERSGKTKSAFIMEAVDEKLCPKKSRRQIVRELAGWMNAEEAAELREALSVFNQVNQGDWD